MNDDFEIEWVKTEAGLAELQRPWKAMLAETDHVSVFQTWEWLISCWNHRHDDWHMWLLLAWDRERRLAGAAPLMLVEDGEGLLRIKRLVFLGTQLGTRYHQDFPARDRDRGPVSKAFVEYLARRRREWDVLDLDGLAEWSAVEPYLRQMPGHFLARKAALSRHLCLPPSYHAFERDNLGVSRSEQLHRERLRLEHDFPGQVVFERVTESRDLAPTLDALQEFDRARGRAGTGEDECATEFGRDFAAAALENGWLRLDRLRAREQTIAVQLGFLYRGVWSSCRSGTDPGWEAYAPGDLLGAHIIQAAIEEGARELDVLQGPEGSEYPWADGGHRDAHIALSTSLPGDAWVWLGAARDGIMSLHHRNRPAVSPR